MEPTWLYTTSEDIREANVRSLSVGCDYLGDLRVRGERNALVALAGAGVGSGRPCMSRSSIERFSLTWMTWFHMSSP